jgi:hypothetical protein
MSAGTGVQHSEFNHSSSERVHFLQIWITPDVTGIEPGYEEKHFDSASKMGNLRLIASADGRDGSVLIHQDAKIFASILNANDHVKYDLAPTRKAYVHLVRGQIEINGIKLSAGDALKISEESLIEFKNAADAELLLFDLPY